MTSFNIEHMQKLWQGQGTQDEAHYPIDKKSVMDRIEKKMRPMIWGASPNSFLAGGLFAAVMGIFYLLMAWEKNLFPLWKWIGLLVGLTVVVSLNFYRYRLHKRNSLPSSDFPTLLHLRAALTRVRNYRKILMLKRYTPIFLGLYILVFVGPGLLEAPFNLAELIAVSAFILFAVGIFAIIARYGAVPELKTYTALEKEIEQILQQWEAEDQG